MENSRFYSHKRKHWSNPMISRRRWSTKKSHKAKNLKKVLQNKLHKKRCKRPKVRTGMHGMIKSIREGAKRTRKKMKAFKEKFDMSPYTTDYDHRTPQYTKEDRKILEQIRKYRSDKLNKRKLRYYRERSKHLPLDEESQSSSSSCKRQRLRDAAELALKYPGYDYKQISKKRTKFPKTDHSFKTCPIKRKRSRNRNKRKDRTQHNLQPRHGGYYKTYKRRRKCSPNHKEQWRNYIQPSRDYNQNEFRTTSNAQESNGCTSTHNCKCYRQVEKWKTACRRLVNCFLPLQLSSCGKTCVENRQTCRHINCPMQSSRYDSDYPNSCCECSQTSSLVS